MKINVVFTPNTRGLGNSLESGQPAHPCHLTRRYTVGCSNLYFDLANPKVIQWIVRKINLDKSMA